MGNTDFQMLLKYTSQQSQLVWSNSGDLQVFHISNTLNKDLNWSLYLCPVICLTFLHHQFRYPSFPRVCQMVNMKKQLRNNSVEYLHISMFQRPTELLSRENSQALARDFLDQFNPLGQAFKLAHPPCRDQHLHNHKKVI